MAEPPPDIPIINAADPYLTDNAPGKEYDDLNFRSDKLHGTLLAMKEILQRMQNILQRSTTLAPEATDSWSQFWWSYKTVAEEVDAEFYKRYNTDMDTVMIFAGLFTAVSATFAGMMQSSLSPDPNTTTQAILHLLILSLNGTTIPDTIMPVWNGPSATMIWVQCFLYASLACSLFVTLGAVLAKQWLIHYSSVGERGTIEDRGLDRQRKLAGQARYHFHTVLEILPVILQLSLLLFGIALSGFILDNQWIIGIVLITANVMGVIFYFYVISSSLVDPDSPFYSPLSSIIKKVSGSVVQRYITLRSAVVTKIESSDPIQQAYLHLQDYMRPVLASVRNFGHVFKGRSRHQSREPSTDDEAQRLSQNMALLKAPGDTRENSSSGRDHHRTTAIVWVLETSTDPSILSHSLAVAHEVYWTESDLRRLSWSLVDRVIIVGLLDCVRGTLMESFGIPAALKSRALAYARGFLLFYWEKLSVDLDGYETWLCSLDRETVQTWRQRWESFVAAMGFWDILEGKTPVNIIEDSDTFFLVYLTLDHLDRMHDHPDWYRLPLLRCRTLPTLTQEMLQARTLVYITQHIWYIGHAGYQMSTLIARLAHRIPSTRARAVHALASGLSIRYWVVSSRHPDLTALLDTDSPALHDVVDSAVQHAEALMQELVLVVERRNEIGFFADQLCNFAQTLPRSLGLSDRVVLRRKHLPVRLLNLCLSLRHIIPTYTFANPKVLSLASELLKTSLSYATSSGKTTIHLLTEDYEWGEELPTPHLDWLISFLAATCVPNRNVAEEELWIRLADAFFVVSHVENFGLQFSELTPSLRRALHICLTSQSWPCHGNNDPLYELQCACLTFIRKFLTGESGVPRIERYALLIATIPALPSAWCCLEAIVASGHDQRHEAVMRVVNWMVESTPDNAWINDPVNDMVVRHWVNTIEPQTEFNFMMQIQVMKAGKLVASDALLQSTDPWWQSPQVRRVALAALSAGWFNRDLECVDTYSDEFLCDRIDQLISTDFWQSETDALLDSEWAIDEILYWMQVDLQKSSSERVRSLTCEVETKLSHIRELNVGRNVSSFNTDAFNHLVAYRPLFVDQQETGPSASVAVGDESDNVEAVHAPQDSSPPDRSDQAEAIDGWEESRLDAPKSSTAASKWVVLRGAFRAMNAFRKPLRSPPV